MTSPSDIADIRALLIGRFDSLEDIPENAAAFELAVWLIGWCDEHPAATLEEYRAAKNRAVQYGTTWPEFRVVPTEESSTNEHDNQLIPVHEDGLSQAQRTDQEA